MDIERTIDISAPRDTVWAIMSDVEHWPEWTASVRSVERLEQGPLATGSRARVRQPRLPVAVWTVTSLDAGRSFEWQNAGPGIKSRGVHTIESTGPAASRVTLGIEWSGPLAPVLRLFYGKLSRRYVDMEANGLKRRAESAHVPAARIEA